MNQLAWLYWNPDRIIFTLPLINHPVAWYGIWFVFGFLIGYIVLVPMFQQRIGKTKEILPRDISNWKTLIKLIQQKTELLNKLSKKSRQSLSIYNKDGQLDSELEAEILSQLNLLITDPKSSQSKREIQDLFPECFHKTYDLSIKLVDKLAWFVIAGTIVGARLGHIFFYEWPRYQKNPIEIIQIWKGGLASHGGAIGVILALYFFLRVIRKDFPEFSFVGLMDYVVVPTAFVGCCIRIGNFFNQEILGNPTKMPWGIIFGDAMDGTPPIPRHPVQLYESVIYIVTFVVLYRLWETRCASLRTGFLSGLFFLLMFIPRFALEFLKTPTSIMIDESFLQTGQLLSIPFILLGFYLVFKEKLESNLFKKSFK